MSKHVNNELLRLLETKGMITKIEQVLVGTSYQDVIDWFREKYFLHISLELAYENKYHYNIERTNCLASITNSKLDAPLEYYQALDKAFEVASKLI